MLVDAKKRLLRLPLLVEAKKRKLNQHSVSCSDNAKCAVRESNPGHLDGNEVLYH